MRDGPVRRRVAILAALVAAGVVCVLLGGETITAVGTSLLVIAVIEAVLVGVELRSAYAVATGTGAARRWPPRTSSWLVAVGALAVVAGTIVRSGASVNPRVQAGEILLIVGLYPLAAGLVMIVSRRRETQQGAD